MGQDGLPLSLVVFFLGIILGAIALISVVLNLVLAV
jgi:hypothetical protein